MFTENIAVLSRLWRNPNTVD